MIKILVADDHAIVRAGLKQLIASRAEETAIPQVDATGRSRAMATASRRVSARRTISWPR